MKRVTDKYFTLLLFNFGKKQVKDVVNEGKRRDRIWFPFHLPGVTSLIYKIQQHPLERLANKNRL